MIYQDVPLKSPMRRLQNFENKVWALIGGTEFWRRFSSSSRTVPLENIWRHLSTVLNVYFSAVVENKISITQTLRTGTPRWHHKTVEHEGLKTLTAAKAEWMMKAWSTRTITSLWRLHARLTRYIQTHWITVRIGWLIQITSKRTRSPNKSKEWSNRYRLRWKINSLTYPIRSLYWHFYKKL